MAIEQDVRAELDDAIRSRDAPRRDVLRQILTEVASARTAPGFSGKIDDGLYQEIIGGYVKKMQKALEEYRGLGERAAAMAEKLEYEVSYLARWLPTKLGSEETLALVNQAIAELGVAGDPKSAGRVIGHVMRSAGGPDGGLDGGLVTRLVRAALESG